ncbi:MAG TPA: hypothetical protein VKB42_01245 [Dongiaceae bacterium]|nr:hypothetical protein [Dongiaceae bacterium]
MTRLSHAIEPKPALRTLLDHRFAAYCRLHASLRPFWQVSGG